MKLDHGLIGNGRLLALIGPDTSVDWLCLPRFDSPSVFGRILDERIGGSWKIEATHQRGTTQSYVRNTNVLLTRVEAEDGTFDVYDFAPWIDLGYEMESPLQLVRLLMPVRGAPRFRTRFDPMLDYARVRPSYGLQTTSIEIYGHPSRMTLFTDMPIDFVLNGLPVTLDGPRFFALCGEGEIRHTERATLLRDQTIRSWIDWARRCAIPDFASAAVLRSALCLKLHMYSPTGAFIAATTTSIPEELGCPRTWDYRFCWLRDSAFVIEALRRLSHIQEGERFLMYLRDVAEAGPLQPVYGIGGERVLDEHILDHLSGYEKCGPVRIGNAAYYQTQHDLMGELLLSLSAILTDERRTLEPAAFWSLIVRLVNDARRALWQPDMGIWEYRTEPKLHVFSQAMCWSALNSGAELAAMLGFQTEAHEWRRIADDAHGELVRRSYNAELGMFTQALEGSWSDAANLLLPVVNFVSARSPQFRSTLVAYERELVKNGLMQRYRHSDDFGMPGSTFTICSFWWAEALALAGDLDAAIEVFNRLLHYSNALGLFSEDIDPDNNRMLGNYPQAYTHVGLINAAVTIGTLKAARDEKIAPWQ